MILGKQRTPVLLFIAAAVLTVCLVLTYIWAREHKTIVPADTPLHEKK